MVHKKQTNWFTKNIGFAFNAIQCLLLLS